MKPALQGEIENRTQFKNNGNVLLRIIIKRVFSFKNLPFINVYRKFKYHKSLRDKGRVGKSETQRSVTLKATLLLKTSSVAWKT